MDEEEDLLNEEANGEFYRMENEIIDLLDQIGLDEDFQKLDENEIADEDLRDAYSIKTYKLHQANIPDTQSVVANKAFNRMVKEKERKNHM